jgi:tripartite-type tricarboxylate transporter receptor subunit TctC
MKPASRSIERRRSDIKVFTPVAKISQNYEVLVVHPAFAARSVAELVAYAKARPGKLNFGSAGHGNATHLAAELFKLRTGIDIVHVPYKGAAEALTGVLGGQVQMFFGDVGGILPLLRDGALRALAVSSETRNALLPDVPTMIESGVPDYVVLTYIGVVAPAGHAGKHHRSAQCRHQRKSHRARRGGCVGQAGGGGTAGFGAGIRGVPCRRDTEMGDRGEGCQHQA